MDMEHIINSDGYKEMIKKSLLQDGNNYRMKKAMMRARKYEKVTLLYLGGSITKQSGNEIENCFANLSYQYFKDNFSMEDNIEYINAGISGTGSMLGLMRFEHEVLPYQPDIVFVEYAVNDSKDELNREVFESLIVSLLELESKPAVILIFMSSDSGYSCQGHMQVIGEHYCLPMISVKDAINWGIQAKILKWSDYSDDNIHPNLFGHFLAAEFIAYYLKKTDQDELDNEFIHPQKPFYGRAFANIRLANANNLEVSSVGSFRDPVADFIFEKGWHHNGCSGNDSFITNLYCKNLFIIYQLSMTPKKGIAEVFIDGSLKATLNGYSIFAWDNPIPMLIFKEDEYKDHTIEIRMADGDEEKEFSLLAFGY